MKYINYTLPLFLLFIISCSENNTNDENGSGSVFILNQGAFQAGNASITAYDPFTNEVQQNYFSQNNDGRPLGDVAQSANLIGDNLFIVVNNSHKIEVVDPETFVANHTINFDNELSPRYIESVGNNKAYITTYTDSVAILDLESLELTGYIDAGSRTEGLAVSGQHAFVANTYHRDFSAATTVKMINTATDEIINTIELREGPSVVKADSQNRIWVVATGPYDENFTHNDAAVYVLNATDGSIIETIELNAGGGDLAFHEDDNTAYISSGGIRLIDMNNLTLSDTQFSTKTFYSLGFDRSVDPVIYGGIDNGAEQSGMAFIYDMEGAVVDSFATGIFPGFFQFEN